VSIDTLYAEDSVRLWTSIRVKIGKFYRQMYASEPIRGVLDVLTLNNAILRFAGHFLTATVLRQLKVQHFSRIVKLEMTDCSSSKELYCCRDGQLRVFPAPALDLFGAASL
jgi:hypothetical protein